MIAADCLLILCLIHLSSGFDQKDCKLGSWTSWSKCSKNCSVGERTRNKPIIQEPQGIFANACGQRIEKEECGSEKNGCQMLCEVETGNCHCESGFLLGNDKKKCYNDNECHHNDGRGPCSQRCEDTIGSYRCLCNSGFILDSDGHACIYNESISCSEKLHIRRSNSKKKCICKNKLDSVRCDRNLSSCKPTDAICPSNTLCQKNIHAIDKCLDIDYQIPILLRMTPYEYNSGNKKYEVEDYVMDILEGNAQGKSLLKLQSDFLDVRKNPTYYVESLLDISVKSSFTLVKYSIMDVGNKFVNLKINRICSLLKTDTIKCVTKKDCDILLEDGIICPPITSYDNKISDYRTNRTNQNKIKSWVYILISGFVLIIILLIILLFMYLKRGKNSSSNAYYDNNNLTQPIILNAEYNTLPQQRDGTISSWNTDPYPDDHFEAGNILYNDDSDKDSLYKSDDQSHIYESIDNLKSCIDKEFGSTCHANDTNSTNDYIDMRYQVPRKHANEISILESICNEKKDLIVLIDQHGTSIDLMVDLPEHTLEDEEYALKNKEGELCSNGLVVDLTDLPENGEPRYASPPGRK